ncbi:IS5/IS1182 family transposase [Pleurocapsa sp. CCALA 161]|uniref:transposase family protein n=1 Tax=Pleurocapsa sp. CCALA 161 TaxID=2107688 RepID=UPI000D05A586|nr:transposase family protein [Pleurocapsa sp. CCALA 161]PSB06698.1 IS5/IS1182 family transposase [Pleurocapsa sp. CCALA 161]
MLNITRALNNDRILRALTGLNRKAFDELCIVFGTVYEESLQKDSAPRKRARGGGRKARLQSTQAKVFFILFYFKCYPTFDVLSIIFDLDRGRSNRWVHRLQGILETALSQKMVLPERKIESIEIFLARFPEVQTVIFDGTERAVQRPQDNDKQKEHYSGKKKRHTRKHITGTTPDKRVILLTPAKPGKIHDIRQLREETVVDNIPDEVEIQGDLGFQGLHNDFVNIHLPHKKPRGKELTETQKQENKAFSAERVVCEHAHAGIKRYNSVTAIYRNRVSDFDDRLMLTATGLWNFYLEAA